MTFRLRQKSKIFTVLCQIVFGDLLSSPHEPFLSLVDKMFHHAQFCTRYFQLHWFPLGRTVGL